MKKTIVCLMALGLSFTFHPLQSMAADPIAASSIPPSDSAQAEAMIFRLNEIKGMDKSNLSFAEKKNLRKEVRSLRKEMKSNGGIYLSVGAIIIIILLLILIL